MGSGIPTDYISSLSNYDGFLIDFFVQLALLEKDKSNVVPLLYSISYGADEVEVGSIFISICDNHFMIMNLTGKTVFITSGDSGTSSFDTKYLPPQTYFNRFNRAYPDISLVAHQYQIKLLGNNDIFFDGTSASSSALAGFVSLVVDQRLRLGKKSQDLLNPLLYSIAVRYPAAFYDVTTGNITCNTSPTCCRYGFIAEKQ
ncbi:unnamed protein product [Rotaria sp. Silwood2]|nr:unnamed protein product [Rotaria sp. Silwood2]CAF4014707.1 unnamed protein product [Rotaria sp. Silwood2]